MAFEDLYDILKTRNLRGVIHCFTGSWEEAQKYLELGFYIGINGIIFKLDLDEVIKNYLGHEVGRETIGCKKCKSTGERK